MIEGFLIHADCQIGGMMPRKRDNFWEYQKLCEVPKAVCFRAVEHYIKVQRVTIAPPINHQHIFNLCKDTARQSGLVPHMF